MPNRISWMTLAALFGLGCLAAAPTAGAAPVVYECLISRSSEAGKTTVYDGSTGQPARLFRFALDVPAGKGCLMANAGCDPEADRLDVFQDETSIVGQGKSSPLMLTYFIGHKQFSLIKGNDTLTSSINGCTVVASDVAAIRY